MRVVLDAEAVVAAAGVSEAEVVEEEVELLVEGLAFERREEFLEGAALGHPLSHSFILQAKVGEEVADVEALLWLTQQTVFFPNLQVELLASEPFLNAGIHTDFAGQPNPQVDLFPQLLRVRSCKSRHQLVEKPALVDLVDDVHGELQTSQILKH